jgi:ABC-type microcin C transport system permease subunit YejE
MTLKKKDCVAQSHPTVDGFLSNFEFSDFVVQRMILCWKLSYPVIYMVVLVPVVLEEKFEVLTVLNFLCFQNLVAMDFDCPLADFLNHSKIDFPKIVYLC